MAGAASGRADASSRTAAGGGSSRISPLARRPRILRSRRHSLKPSARLDGVVVNTSKQTMPEPPPRGSTVGVAGAKMVVLRALRTMPDGARLDDESADIFVTVGDDPNRFLERLRAHGEQPACFIGIDFDGALERLIRAGHGHLSVTRRTMQDLDRLSSDIALAGREGTLSVVLLSDEDPPRWDVEAAATVPRSGPVGLCHPASNLPPAA